MKNLLLNVLIYRIIKQFYFLQHFYYVLNLTPKFAKLNNLFSENIHFALHLSPFALTALNLQQGIYLYSHANNHHQIELLNSAAAKMRQRKLHRQSYTAFHKCNLFHQANDNQIHLTLKDYVFGYIDSFSINEHSDQHHCPDTSMNNISGYHVLHTTLKYNIAYRMFYISLKLYSFFDKYLHKPKSKTDILFYPADSLLYTQLCRRLNKLQIYQFFFWALGLTNLDLDVWSYTRSHMNGCKIFASHDEEYRMLFHNFYILCLVGFFLTLSYLYKFLNYANYFYYTRTNKPFILNVC